MEIYLKTYSPIGKKRHDDKKTIIFLSLNTFATEYKVKYLLVKNCH